MDRTLHRVLALITTASLVASLWMVTAATPIAAQDASEAGEPDTDASIEAFIEALTAEIERTDELIGAVEEARRRGLPAFVVPPGRVLELTTDEVNILVAYSRSRGGVFKDAAGQFRLAEMLAQARDHDGGLKPGSTDDLVTKEEFEAYEDELSTLYGELDGVAREHRAALDRVIEELASIAEEAEAEAEADDPDDPGATTEPASTEGPFRGASVFETGYFLERSKFPVTQVVAWRNDHFDPSWARFHYAAATPDEEAEDPDHRIEKIRKDVAAMDDVTVVLDDSFAGFCAWAKTTCPNTSPKFAGNPVCEDGRPVVE